MQAIKPHIAFLFLLGFVFPQVNSSLHYLLVPHDFSSGSTTVFVQPDLRFQYHSCHYFFNIFSPDLPPENGSPELKVVGTTGPPFFNSLDNYVHHPDFNFQLRGPPLLHKDHSGTMAS